MDYVLERKKFIISIFFYVASAVLVSFMFINYFIYHDTRVALINFFASLILFGALYLLKRRGNIRLAILLSSFNLFFFFLLYIHFNQNRDFGLIWTVFVPIFIIPLNGPKRGLVLSLLFYLIAFWMAYRGIGVWQDGAWNMHSFLRFVVASLMLVYVVYISEKAIVRTNDLLRKKEEKEQEYIQQLQLAVERDHLTGLYNRRRMSEILQEVFEESRQDDRPILALLDLDYFKKINDTYGHNVGDEVLKESARILKKTLRRSDIVARWGGEEFLILFLRTDLEAAKDVCERIRKNLSVNPFVHGEKLTCSIGMSACDEDFTNWQEWLEAADQALYEAKAKGRDQICISRRGDSNL